MQALVQQECKEPVNLVEEPARPLPHHDDQTRPSQKDGREADQRIDIELSLHPEMISPAFTLKLMQRVMKRFTKTEDALALLMEAAEVSKTEDQGIVGIDGELMASLYDDIIYPSNALVT